MLSFLLVASLVVGAAGQTNCQTEMERAPPIQTTAFSVVTAIANNAFGDQCRTLETLRVRFRTINAMATACATYPAVAPAIAFLVKICYEPFPRLGLAETRDLLDNYLQPAFAIAKTACAYYVGDRVDELFCIYDEKAGALPLQLAATTTAPSAHVLRAKAGVLAVLEEHHRDNYAAITSHP